MTDFFERYGKVIIIGLLTALGTAIGAVLLDYRAMQYRVEGLENGMDILTTVILQNQNKGAANEKDIESIRTQLRITDQCVLKLCTRQTVWPQEP